MADHLLDLTDGLVSLLNAATFSQSIDAEWQDDPTIELDDAALKSPVVWVIDYAFSQLTRNGVPIEEYELIVVVQKKLDAKTDGKTQCRALSGLVNQLELFCRTTPIVFDGEAAVCFGTKRETARDFGEYVTNGKFDAEFSAFYRRVADDSE